MKHEEEHIDIRERLLKLPKVKAKDGFENELMRRINLLETEKQPERRSAGIFDLLFGKKSLAWSIPAMSLTVIAIVAIGVYFIFYNNGEITKKQDSSITKTEQTTAPTVPPSSVTKTEENKPGKEIANDLDVGKTSRLEKKTEVNSGYNETFSTQPAPKIESKRSSVDELKTSDQNFKKSEDVMQKIVQPSEKQEGVNKGTFEEKKKEMPRKFEESEKDNAISPKKDIEGVEKSDVMSKETGKDAKKESKKKKANKEKDLTKEVLESLSKKIKDNQ